MFNKKNKKPYSFLKMYGRNPQIFQFLREKFQNWLKFLGCPQNFWRFTLKNVKMLLKNLFLRNFLYFSL